MVKLFDFDILHNDSSFIIRRIETKGYLPFHLYNLSTFEETKFMPELIP